MKQEHFLQMNKKKPRVTSQPSFGNLSNWESKTWAHPDNSPLPYPHSTEYTG